MCRFAAPLAFNFMAAVAIPPSSRHSEGDYDVQDTVSNLFEHLQVTCLSSVLLSVLKHSCQHALAAECCSIVHRLSASTAGMELHSQVIPWWWDACRPSMLSLGS